MDPLHTTLCMSRAPYAFVILSDVAGLGIRSSEPTELSDIHVKRKSR